MVNRSDFNTVVSWTREARDEGEEQGMREQPVGGAIGTHVSIKFMTFIYRLRSPSYMGTVYDALKQLE